MSHVGRNHPCPCGSGRKAKRCCGVRPGPSEDQLARAFLEAQAQRWAPTLTGCDATELDELQHEVFHLPEVELALQVPLPRVTPPAFERVRRAMLAGDDAAVPPAVAAAVEALDTPALRAHLARGVLALHDDGHRIACAVAAYALLDLAPGGPSALVWAAVTQTAAVASGSARTPAGLLVAAR